MLDIRNAAKFAMHNRKDLENSSICGCFHCLALFNPKQIKEWTDEDNTAVCPFCSIDAVLAETCGIHLDTIVLNKLNTYWFGR